MKFLLSALILHFWLFSEAQNIRQITASKTYLYSDTSMPSLKIDPSYQWEFDEKGRLLKDSDIEGICYQYNKYDENDRKYEYGYHCGEGMMENKVYWKENLRIDSSSTSMGEHIRVDSLNSNGQIIKSTTYSKEFPNTNEDSLIISKNIILYEYDTIKNETIKNETDEKGNFFLSEKMKYGEFGLLIYKIHYGSDGSMMDSAIYTYDYMNRLIKAQRLTKLDQGPEEILHYELTIEYDITAIRKYSIDGRKFNDSIISSCSPYSQFDFEVKLSSQPSSIRYQIFYTPDNFSKNVLFTYKYVSGGSLVQIKGRGNYDDDKELMLDVNITYSRNDKATVIYSGTDQYGYPAYGDIYEYENRLLKTKTEKGNDGTVTSITNYSYGFYK